MPFIKGQSGNYKGKPIGTKSKDKNLILRYIYEDLIGTFKNGNFYVYYHIDIDKNKIVYIGKGINNRAWDFKDSARNNEWCTYKNNNNLNVKIIASNLSEDEALAIEKALIEINKPILNLYLNI